MYRVLIGLEYLFGNIQEAEEYCKANDMVEPAIPALRSKWEDNNIPRISVAVTPEHCLTKFGAMGLLQKFKAANYSDYIATVKSREVYPIIIQQFHDDYPVIVPTRDLVPDVEYTGELWALNSMQPLSTELCWLAPTSILWAYSPEYVYCRSYTPVTLNPSRHCHPWINGKGGNMF